MPTSRKTMRFRSAAAAQRFIDEAGGDAIVNTTFTVDRRSKQEKTEAQKQREAAERSKLERRFADLWRYYCPEIELTPQYVFHPGRKWPFDFAIPSLKVAFEIDGGTWSDERSGHNWGTGITRDYEKQNAAIVDGWQVFRFTSDMMARKNLPAYVEPVAGYVRQLLSILGE